VSESRATKEGVEGARPGREAFSTYTGRRSTRRRGEEAMVPEADFSSYYGKPIINKPVWHEPDIPGYLFLGGLAGGSSVIAAGAALTGQRALARTSRIGAASAAGLSLVALVHDLGRPERFINMLRVFKVSSPMNVGAWLLSAYAPAAMVAAASDVTGRVKPLGALATAGAATLGPAVASYTATLISDTAVPAWHDGHREMPFVFVGSGAMAAGGLGLMGAPVSQQSLPRWTAVLGSATELVGAKVMEKRIGLAAEPYRKGRPRTLMRRGQILAGAGLLATVLGRRNRVAGAFGGACLVASSAFTRFGIFRAGLASAEDPRYIVQPQRERLRGQEPEGSASPAESGPASSRRSPA
jgi:hypothetical protein